MTSPLYDGFTFEEREAHEREAREAFKRLWDALNAKGISLNGACMAGFEIGHPRIILGEVSVKGCNKLAALVEKEC